MSYVINNNGLAVAQIKNVAVIAVDVKEPVFHSFDNKTLGVLKGDVKYDVGEVYNKLVLTYVSPVIKRGVMEVLSRDVTIPTYCVKGSGELTILGSLYNFLDIEFHTDNVDDDILSFDFDRFEAPKDDYTVMIEVCNNLQELVGKRLSFKPIKVTTTIDGKAITYEDIDYSSIAFVETKKTK